MFTLEVHIFACMRASPFGQKATIKSFLPSFLSFSLVQLLHALPRVRGSTLEVHIFACMHYLLCKKDVLLVFQYILFYFIFLFLPKEVSSWQLVFSVFYFKDNDVYRIRE